ncbi:hypothetical protein EV359DRAFT_80491 [Lentinula novae-zelandiae]|nr:hypothetical protein EV359DRAFT_80491 [Lentinula novae-zelandiae]
MSLTFDLNDTLGAAFIGYSISCVIFGIFTTQAISFYHRYRTDPLNLKILVGVVWCTELLHQTLVAHALYHYTVSLFGSPIAVFTEPVEWSLVTQVLVGAISGSIVKASRLEINRNKIVTAALAVVILVQIGCILGSLMYFSRQHVTNDVYITAYEVGAFRLQNILDIAKIKVVASLALATGALADFLIAVALCYYLRKLRTGYREPDSLLNSLVQYALNTGALTSTMSILTLVLDINQYDARTSTFQYMGVYFVLSKMFAVSFMCALSTRKQVTGKVGDEYAYTNGGFGGFTAETSLRTVNHIDPYPLKPQATVQDSSVSVELESWNAENQLYEVQDEYVSLSTVPALRPMATGHSLMF